MGGFVQSPTWNPPQPPIPLGIAGQVLTMVGGVPAFANASGGGGGFASGILTYASPAGSQNDVNPGGAWPTNIGLVQVTLAGGNSTWNGLVAGSAGQAVLIVNTDATNSLTFRAQNAGSSAANRFLNYDQITLIPGYSIMAVYFAGTLNRWVLR